MAKAAFGCWKAIAQSVRGAAHDRADLPNQDAFKLFPESGGSSVIATVSDGHGSSECFRSDVGAAIAVKVAIEALTPLLEPSGMMRLPTLKHLVEQQLPRDIVTRWRREIDKHIEANPLPSETEIAESGNGSVQLNRYVAYGATLLGVLVTEEHMVYLQLGDGDIVSVSKDGRATRAISKDERLIANFTTSLCMPDATREMRVGFETISEDVPAMIMLSTDGYSNSFVDEQSFLRVGPDVLAAIKDNGLEAVGRRLGEWLDEASRLGSGDDTTVAILFRDNWNKDAMALAPERPV